MIPYSVAPRLTNIAEYQVAKKANPDLKQSDFPNAKFLYYGNAQCLENMDLEAFSNHIADHGCSYDAADVQAILKKAVGCLREQLLAGKSVELGDLGSFRLTLISQGAEYMDEFSTSNIKKVNVVWNKGAKFDNLRKDASFHEVLTKDSTAETLAAAKRAAGSRPVEDTSTDNADDANPTNQHTLTLAANPANGGTVTGGGSYAQGTTATLSATPNTGFRFVQWDDGVTQATRTVTVTEDKTYTATFASTSGGGAGTGGQEQG